MPLNPQKFSENEAWLLFQLNEEPVRTQADGDFNVYSIMDVASGLILGTEFISTEADEPSEFESRRLLSSSESRVGTRPQSLYVDLGQPHGQIAKVATAMGMKVIPERAGNLSPITREAREGFAAHVMQGSRQSQTH